MTTGIVVRCSRCAVEVDSGRLDPAGRCAVCALRAELASTLAEYGRLWLKRHISHGPSAVDLHNRLLAEAREKNGRIRLAESGQLLVRPRPQEGLP